ncbi:unnamed protein product [Paramecium sonneborni]|uniref:Uncharacterized protein n=1 Tax=Paramecium sonneborni TaxID=65129 RepID=A0A8S1Q8B4_9CILI|nr:unnamed protein product [Paramecium sonneborni]
MHIKVNHEALFIYIMIGERKKEKPQNPHKINDNVDNDDLDQNLCDNESDYYIQNTFDDDMIGDNEKKINITKNQRNIKKIERKIIKFNNPNQINDMESNSHTYLSLFDEQEEQQQILEEEQNCKVKKANKSQYRSFKKEQKKQTEYFD